MFLVNPGQKNDRGIDDVISEHGEASRMGGEVVGQPGRERISTRRALRGASTVGRPRPSDWS